MLLPVLVLSLLVGGTQTRHTGQRSDREENRSTTKGLSRCASDWSELGDRCYRYFTETVHHTAVARCHTLGGTLALPKTNNINSRLFHIGGHIAGGWIGVNDLEQEGHYVFADDTSLPDKKLYNLNEPNNRGGNEDCTEMKRNGHWNDVSCSKLCPYFCETDRDTETTSKAEEAEEAKRRTNIALRDLALMKMAAHRRRHQLSARRGKRSDREEKRSLNSGPGGVDSKDIVKQTTYPSWEHDKKTSYPPWGVNKCTREIHSKKPEQDIKDIFEKIEENDRLPTEENYDKLESAVRKLYEDQGIQDLIVVARSLVKENNKSEINPFEAEIQKLSKTTNLGKLPNGTDKEEEHLRFLVKKFIGDVWAKRIQELNKPFHDSPRAK